MFECFKRKKARENGRHSQMSDRMMNNAPFRIQAQRIGTVEKPNERIYCLQHIENREFICCLQEATDYLACFSSGDAAFDFRASLGLLEHVDIHVSTFAKSAFNHFWFDGQLVVLNRSS